MTTDLRELYQEACDIQHHLSDFAPDERDPIDRLLGRLLAYAAMRDAEVKLLRHEMEQVRGERVWRFYLRSAQ